jgi:hypothetical protein
MLHFEISFLIHQYLEFTDIIAQGSEYRKFCPRQSFTKLWGT